MWYICLKISNYWSEIISLVDTLGLLLNYTGPRYSPAHFYAFFLRFSKTPSNILNCVMIKCLKTTEMSVQLFYCCYIPKNLCMQMQIFFANNIRYQVLLLYSLNSVKPKKMQCFYGVNFSKPQCVKSARIFCVYCCKWKRSDNPLLKVNFKEQSCRLKCYTKCVVI